MRIFLLFPALFALLELVVLIEVGEAIGTLATIVLVVAGAVCGAAFLKRGGIGALRRAQASVAAGETPTGALFDGACHVLAGLLFILPGFVSDALALPLLFPPVRRWLLAWLGRRLGVRHREVQIIEGEWHEVRDETTRLPR
ncbi:MAG: FxsA family protein [Rhodospirillales bacterium]|nr:FxsA family protein [Rhodospirillales bacterium]